MTTSHETDDQQPDTGNQPEANRRSPKGARRNRQVFVRLSDGEYGDLAAAPGCRSRSSPTSMRSCSLPR